MHNLKKTEEEKRLDDANSGKAPWRLWGPYLSERQWGTVREDYSDHGDAWKYFPHDHARSRAYRWGEDGIAGISDEKQQLCFALGLWNGKDPIVKERLFGLSGSEGNHGEDVKEYYFYLDNIPSHAYMKYLYKYPTGAFPYNDLVATNGKRSRQEPEYELLDTGIFDENRYYDVFVEYAKVDPEEILIQFTIANRGEEAASLDLLPTLWFRNTWGWGPGNDEPSITLAAKKNDVQIVKASHSSLGDFWLYCDSPDAVLFTNNETNKQRLFNLPNDVPFVKDGINDYFVHGQKQAVNPKNKGTKAAVHYHLQIGAGEAKIVKLRLSRKESLPNPFSTEFGIIFSQRKKEADLFYEQVTPYPISDDMRSVQRQAFAGLLWNKQCYHYNVATWLKGDPTGPVVSKERQSGRNHRWKNFDAYDVISMPDKWEFPWLASWDLSFHTTSLALIDPEFAKSQLILLTREWYMSVNGQLPAYEWDFGDLNPPLQVWAALHVYQLESVMYGRKDRNFLERIFQKLVINFTWWVNRRDAAGDNTFEGGFLGLDNICAFDRTRDLPKGYILEQRDATGWMGMYCIKLLEISLELASEDSAYEGMATKFFEHFVTIGDSINDVVGDVEGLWDEEKGFYYGVLVSPDGKRLRLSQNNLAGIVPLFAVGIGEPDTHKQLIHYKERFSWFTKKREKMLHTIINIKKEADKERILLSFVDDKKLSAILKLILDEKQFLSPYGLRSVSKLYAQNPFTVRLGEKEFTLDYEPAESRVNLFGGNSNWRGPIWFPLNYLFIESLEKFYDYYGDDFTVEYPEGSGNKLTLSEVSNALSNRMINIFLKDKNGRRPVYGGIEKFQNDPHWRDYILFHEYFNGDDGAGLGASNQTGWTGLVANLIYQQGKLLSKQGASHECKI